MKTTRLLLLLPILLTTLYSCQKEGKFQDDLNSPPGGGGGTGGNTQTLEGDYDFVGLVAHTVSDISLTDAGETIRAVTTSDYTSKNPKGAAKFTSNQFSYTNFSYTVDTVINLKTYINGVLDDDSDVPFLFDYPATSASSPFVRNRTDSLTFPSQVMGVSSGFSGGGPTGPMGATLSWSGNVLSLKVSGSFINTIVQAGVPAQMKASFSTVMKFKKK